MAESQALIVGEVLFDIDSSSQSYTLGGAPANVAARVHELGGRAAFVSRVGSDDLGAEALRGLQARGMPIDLVQEDREAKTGTVLVQREQGSKDVSYTILNRVAYDRLEFTPQVHAAAQASSLIYFGTLFQRTPENCKFLEQVLDATKLGCERFVDVNLRRDCWSKDTIELSLARASTVKMNNDELGAIYNLAGFRPRSMRDQAKELMRRYDISRFLLTLGANGAILFTSDGGEYVQPGFVAAPGGDTIGAGDAFSASIIKDLLSGGFYPERSLERACRMATIVASQRGGFEALPADWRTRELAIRPLQAEFPFIEHERTRGMAPGNAR